MFSKKDEGHTAKYYYEKAELHKNILKSQLQIFLKTGIFVLAAAVGLVLVTMSWFFHNTQVSARGSSIGVQAGTYVLASVGQRQIEKTKYLSEEGGSQPVLSAGDEKNCDYYYVQREEGWEKVSSSQTYYTVNAEEVAWYLGRNMSLFPGSREQMDFYIIPSVNGAQTITFNLTIKPFMDDNGKAKEIVDNSALDDLLLGHILFFGCTSDSECSNWLAVFEDGQAADGITGMTNRLTVALPEDAEANVPYQVSITAVWSKRFQNMIYLGRKNQGDLFVNKSEDYTRMSEFISMQSTKESLSNTAGAGKSNYLFLMGNQDTAENPFIPQPAQGEGYDAMEYTKAVQCGSYYNLADEYIGERVSYLLISISDSE